ncbi:hypothetical protein ACJ41O_002326 [Fusarium nematophilum]
MSPDTSLSAHDRPPSSVSRPETATATELLTLTTPFEQPRGCGSHWMTTSALATDGDSTSTVPILVSKAVPSCYPSGWEDSVPESRFRFNAAACPRGWDSDRIGQDAGTGSSTAICCNSGYTYLNNDDCELATSASISTHQCGRWVQKNTDDRFETATDDEHTTLTSHGRTLMVHEAWTISWDASDTTTRRLELRGVTYSDEPPEDDHPFHWSMGLYLIAVPIICAIILGVGIWCAVRRCKRRRREKLLGSRDGTELR